MVLVEMPSWVALIDANVFAVSLAQAICLAPFGCGRKGTSRPAGQPALARLIREKPFEVFLYHRFRHVTVHYSTAATALHLKRTRPGTRTRLQHRLGAVVAHPLLDHSGVDGNESPR